MRLAFCFVCAVLGAIVGPRSALAQAPDHPALSASIAEALRSWKVAGLAVAVVQRDRVVYQRGFGRRDIRGAEAVDERTVFAIGSMTKFFTAVAAGMMVDAGRMTWDDPIRRYLPDFTVGDPYVTAHLSMRDALTHRSGLDWRLDFLWYGTSLTTSQVIARLRDFVPEPAFRAGYGYSNVMFATAGEAIAQAAGKPWSAVIRERILEPLAMRSTTTGAALDESGNVATPHTNFGARPEPIPRVGVDNIPAAGALHSTTADLSRWLRFVLRRGELDGRRLIQRQTLEQILAPQVVIGPPDSLLRAVTKFSLYGMGVEVSDYRGHRLVKHSGKIDGMRAAFALVPDVDLGAVILTNTSGPAGVTDLPEALVLQVIDVFLGAPRVDWAGKFLADREATLRTRRRAESEASASRALHTSPSLPLELYAGSYAGPIGNAPASATDDELLRRIGPFAAVTYENGQLMLRLGPVVSRLEHWQHDTFRAVWNPLGQVLVTFVLDSAGRIERLRGGFFGDYERVRGN